MNRAQDTSCRRSLHAVSRLKWNLWIRWTERKTPHIRWTPHKTLRVMIYDIHTRHFVYWSTIYEMKFMKSREVRNSERGSMKVCGKRDVDMSGSKRRGYLKQDVHMSSLKRRGYMKRDLDLSSSKRRRYMKHIYISFNTSVVFKET